MKVCVIRHGQTDLNIQRRMQGRRGFPLNDTGKAQALSAKEELKDVKFDLIFSSPQERAFQTASIVAPYAEILTDPRLDVFDVGTADGEVIEEKNMSLFGIVPDSAVYEGVEEPGAFKSRVYSFMDELTTRYGETDKVILISGHKCTTGCIDCYFNGMPENGDFFSRSSKNGKYKIYGE